MNFKFKQILTNSNNPVFLITDNKNDYILKKTNRNEIDCLNKLESSHFPKIHETFQNKGDTYLIENFIEGITVKELVENDNLTDEDILKIILNCLEMLVELNQNNIVNRDIKPSHILVDSDYNTFLIDFNTAKFEENTDSIDEDVIGTRGYAAPERYKGKSFCNSDVYSLGCVLYFMIFKHPPVEPNNSYNKRLLFKDFKKVKNPKLSKLLKLLCSSNVKHRLNADEILERIR